MATDTPATATTITVLRSHMPTGKRFRLEDGKLAKSSVAYALGDAIGRSIDSANRLVALLQEATADTHVTLVPGHFVHNDADVAFEIVRTADLREILDLTDDAPLPSGIQVIPPDGHRVAARVKDSVEPCAWILLDFDSPPGMPAELARLTPAQRLDRLDTIVPGISRCTRVELRSSSARIVPPEREPGARTHAWIRVSDAEKVDLLRVHAYVEAAITGLGFTVERRAKADGRVVGHAHLTLVDLSVWHRGRIVFCSAPTITPEMEAAGWQVVDAGITVVNPDGGVLDLSTLKRPTDRRRAKFREVTGEHLTISGEGRSFAITSRGTITLDAELETNHADVPTIRKALELLRGKPDDKLRCQTPMRRESRSEAAFLRWTGPGLCGFIFDSGTNTTYRIDDPDAGPSVNDARYLQSVIAQEFVEQHGRNFRYVKTRRQWFHWNELCWEPEDTDLVISLLDHLMAGHSFDAGGKLGHSDLRGAEAIARAHRNIAMRPEAFDADPNLLTHLSGTYDFRTGTTRPWSREDYITKCAQAAPRGRCPTFTRFMTRITAADVDLQLYLLRVLGYCLTGHTYESVFFHFFGGGRNGKSTLVETVARIMGAHARKIETSVFIASRFEQHPTSRASIAGRRLIYTGEIGPGKRWDIEMLKALTGGDTLSARFMRQDDFEFLPVAKLVVMGNHKPNLRRVDRAMRARLHLVPFTVDLTTPASEHVPNMKALLWEERDGIFDALIRGAHDWQVNGLAPPSAVLEATSIYFDSQDTIGRWKDECCEMGEAYKATAADLHKSYRRWAEANGEPLESQRSLANILGELPGLEAFKGTGGVRSWRGLRLTPAEAGAIRDLPKGE